MPHKQPQPSQTQHQFVAASLSQQAHYGNSPQRRFLSEGELVRQANVSNTNAVREFTYARSNNTVDNIRELAGSPQRSIYMWKDTSPGYQGVVSSSSQKEYGMAGVSGNGSGEDCISPVVANSSSIANNVSSEGCVSASVHFSSVLSGGAGDSSGRLQFITVNCGSQRSHPLIMTHSRMQHHQDSAKGDYPQSVSMQRSNPTSPITAPSSANSAITATNSYLMCYGNSSGGPVSVHQPSNTSFVVASNANPPLAGSVYQPKLHGGVAVFPPNVMPNSSNQNTKQPSPQIKRKQTPTRPMSFVRALEMTDSMEMQTLEQQQQNRNNDGIRTGPVAGGNLLQHSAGSGSNNRSNSNSNNNARNTSNSNKNSTSISERASVYDMNYEISV